jgi:hypothetical protein
MLRGTRSVSVMVSVVEEPAGVVFAFETVLEIVATVVPPIVSVPLVDMIVWLAGRTVFARCARQLMVTTEPVGMAT